MEQAQHFLTQYSGHWAYVFFFFLIFACSIGLPFNSDICLISASVLAASKFFNFYVLMILAFTALTLGDSCTFFAGRTWGLELIKRKPFCWLFPQKNIQRAQNFLQNRGSKVVFLFRFMPLIRTILFFTSGTLQVRPTIFYAMNISATLLYLPLIMGTSYYASENINEVVLTLKKLQFSVLGVAAAVLFYFIRKSRRTRT